MSQAIKPAMAITIIHTVRRKWYEPRTSQNLFVFQRSVKEISFTVSTSAVGFIVLLWDEGKESGGF